MATIDRRTLIAASLAGTATLALGGLSSSASAQSNQNTIKPERLRSGDTVMIVAPAGVEYNKFRLTLSIESLEALGLKVKVAENTLNRHGYFPAEDQIRAAEINQAFADDDVKAVIALKGGWGAARTLPYLDWDLIANNPKILMGYSDITSLLNAVYQKTGLITFHGPNAGSAWGEFTTSNVKEILFDAAAQHMENPREKGQYLTVRQNRTQSIVSGEAEGRMVGGNLTVLTALQGTPYFPDLKDKILLLEDIGENIYRVDRMLTQLSLGGHLKDCAGIVFGGMTDVDSDGGYGDFSLMDILEQHCVPVGIPTFIGAMFGHISDKRTMAIGCNARIDADAGTITMLESAVS